jgi:DNA-binding FadR family transcriptional regulator
VPTVKRTSLADQTALLLADRIRAGEWAVGTRLPGENSLAAQFSVGRSTIREAIRQLAGRGVLTTRQGAGVFVASVEPTESWDDLLVRADIAEIVEARIAIESEAAALAARRHTPVDLDAIRAALAQRLGHGRLSEHVDADTAFHRAVVAASHNAILVEMFDGFVPRVRTAMTELLDLTPDFDDTADHAAHAALVDAIEGRDVDEARRLSRDHLTALSALLPPRSIVVR